MFDQFHLPNDDLSQQVFYAGATGEFRVWNKPRGAKLVTIVCLGSGGGGGGGFSGASGSARGGGGGGGGAAVTRVTIPAMLLPDVLYVQVAKGGLSGAAGVDGTIGGFSYVSIFPNTSSVNNVCASGITTPAGNGKKGTAAAGGATGAAGLVSSTVNTFMNLGVWTSAAGIIGSAGGAITGAVGTSQGSLTNTVITGGAGGGSTPAADTDFAGGGITSNSLFVPALSGGAAGGGDGDAGKYLLSPFYATGGCGGGTNGAAGVGGRGGDGAYGCGGGGGGGGVTGGAGGNGGDGLVFIFTI
jgi:hypothetical protein